MQARTIATLAGALLGAALLGAPAAAQTCADLAGAADHPELPRYEGSCLIGFASQAFARVELPTGKAVKRDGRWVGETAELLEGAATRLLYVAPEGRSPLEVFENYRAALGERGFEIRFACAGKDCGNNEAMGRQIVYPAERRLDSSGDLSRYAFSGLKDEHYLAARSQDGSLWLGLYVAQNDFKRFPETYLRAIAHLDVIQVGAMEQRMLDAAAMATALGESGRVAIENVYFDFAQATLKPESAEALAEMARLLADNPALQVYIVGHTDNVGSYEANLELSRRRAEAVAGALVAQHGIDPARVVPAGVASLSPLASNKTEAGRAQNRRVELVER
jgi:OOP family OmpA-OmpF porin